MPVLIHRGKNIECGEDVCNHEVEVAKCKVSPGTNPMSLKFSTVRRQALTYASPSSATEDPYLGILY